MREKKFREWLPDEKKMLNFDDTIAMLNAIRWRIMEYTGQTDKNGKEIWEGDIIIEASEYYFNEDGPQEGQVYWDDTYAGFCIQWKYSDPSKAFIKWQKHEIIGNIYENPELRIIRGESSHG